MSQPDALVIPILLGVPARARFRSVEAIHATFYDEGCAVGDFYEVYVRPRPVLPRTALGCLGAATMGVHS